MKLDEVVDVALAADALEVCENVPYALGDEHDVRTLAIGSAKFLSLFHALPLVTLDY